MPVLLSRETYSLLTAVLSYSCTRQGRSREREKLVWAHGQLRVQKPFVDSLTTFAACRYSHALGSHVLIQHGLPGSGEGLRWVAPLQWQLVKTRPQDEAESKRPERGSDPTPF